LNEAGFAEYERVPEFHLFNDESSSKVCPPHPPTHPPPTHTHTHTQECSTTSDRPPPPLIYVKTYPHTYIDTYMSVTKM
jgi:hypothetical protein